jgi:hypothetical protein
MLKDCFAAIGWGSGGGNIFLLLLGLLQVFGWSFGYVGLCLCLLYASSIHIP